MRTIDLDFAWKIRQTGMCSPWGTLLQHCFKIVGFIKTSFSSLVDKTTMQRTKLLLDKA